MFKVYCFLQGEAFQYAGNEARDTVVAACPGIAGYTQSTPLDEQLPGQGPAVYSGIIEMWFTRPEQALAATAAPMITARSKVARQVIGHERVVMRLPDHHTEPRIKAVYPFRRKPGMSIADFQTHWWHAHGPIAALTEEALCYTQTHVLPECYTDSPPDCDGVTELHFRHRDAAIRAAVSRQMREDQGGDAVNFVDPASIEMILVREDIIIAP